jgi:hypothetical protein
MSFALFLLITI